MTKAKRVAIELLGLCGIATFSGGIHMVYGIGWALVSAGVAMVVVAYVAGRGGK